LSLLHHSRIKFLRRALLAVIGVAISAVAINYFLTLRTRSKVIEDPPTILSEEMARSAETIEYVEHRAGQAQFKLRADRLLETRGGKNLLEGIEAEDYHPDGSVRNQIRSRRAEYDREAKQAFFSGDVRIQIGEQYQLEMNSLHYDLAGNVGHTDDLVRLVSPGARGIATGIRYDTERKILELKRELDFVFEAPAGTGNQGGKREEYHILANRGYYSESRHALLFAGEARLNWPASSLRGDEIRVLFSPDREQVTALSCEGNAVYRSELDREVRILRGDGMLFTLDPVSKGLQSIEVKGRAGFSQSSPSANQELEASELLLIFENPAGSLASVRARSVDRFRILSSTGSTSVSAGTLQLQFAPGSRAPEKMILHGMARVFTGSEAEDGMEELRADEIQVDFEAEREFLAPRKIEALRSVEWISPGREGGSGRSLAADYLAMSYARSGPYLQSGFASGHVTIMLLPNEIPAEAPESASTVVRRLKSEQVRFFFHPDSNQLKEFTGQGNVEVDYQARETGGGASEDTNFHTASSRIRAVFPEEKGAISSVSQWGDFEYRDSLRSITAESCEYRDSSNSLLLDGSPRIRDADATTSGSAMEFDRDRQILTVHGQVRSVLSTEVGPDGILSSSDQASSPSIVTADEMRYWVEESRVRYTGNVQLLAESGQLQADTLSITDSGESVEARGGVVHLILAQNGAARAGSHDSGTAVARHVQIRSANLNYLRIEGVIRYSGGVLLTYGDTVMSSERLDVILDRTGKKVERATAQGELEITQGVRKAKGDRAEYFLEPGKFVVTGESAHIFDPARGRSFARRLTFFTASDRILLENSPNALRD